MNNNELRIGNLVTIEPNKEYKQVVDVLCDGVNTLDIEGANYAFVHPIDLTEDMLSKIGFTKSKWMEGRWDLPNGDEMSQFHICPLNDRFVFRGLGMSIVYVDTVHHLQNIIFVITGKELDVTPLLNHK